LFSVLRLAQIFISQHNSCKSLKLLGFIKRITKEFKSASPPLRRCTAQSTVIWDPNTAQNAIMLERVQNKFLKYASSVLRTECPSHNYLPVLEHLKLDSMADRRLAANLKFIYKLLNGQIDSPRLLLFIPKMSLLASFINIPLLICQPLPLIMV